MQTDIQHPSFLLPADPGSAESVYHTRLGEFYHGDSLPLLRQLPDASVNTVFCDPPFNLDKDYGEEVGDNLSREGYLRWSRRWIVQACRVLKPGGALFIFNLPKWLVHQAHMLEEEGMEFRHWIAMRMPKGFTRGKRLSPAHYGCVYYTKGEPRVFNKVHVPIPTCRHCGGEIRDYGGHRKKLDERGLNMMDVFERPEEVFAKTDNPQPAGRGWAEADDMWEDIPTVRHNRYKRRGANQLAPILLERLIAMSTDEGDLVLDPFAGTGATSYAAEKLDRRWMAIELGDPEPAIERMEDYRAGEDEEWESARGGLVSSSAGRKGSASAEQISLFSPEED